MTAGAWAALRLWGTPPAARDDVARWADGRPARVVGRVLRPPERSARGETLLLRAEWLKAFGAAPRPVSGNVVAFCAFSSAAAAGTTPAPRPVWGDRVSLWGPLVPSRPAAAPGLYDSAAADERRGARARQIVPAGKAAVVERLSPFSPRRWAGALRDRLGSAFAARLSPRSSEILGGLVLGRRPRGVDDLMEDFRRSGTAHLLVASGSNVGIALALWWFLARWALWWPRRWTLLAVPFWAFLYAGVAGGDAPVLRAALMASLGAFGHALGRWDRPEHPIFLSAGILLAIHPASLFEAGFQMSYAATLGIAVAWNRIQGAPPPSDPRTIGAARAVRGFGLHARRLFGMSLAAQAALAPLLLFYFGRFSVAGLLSNMIAVPASGLCLTLGLCLFGFETMGWTPAARGLAAVTERAVGAFLAWVRFSARLPGAELHARLSFEQTIFLSAGILAAFAFLLTRRRFFGWWAAAAGAAALLLGAARPPAPPFRLVWWGRDAVFLQTPAGVGLFDSTKDGTLNGLPGFLGGLGVERLAWRHPPGDFRPAGAASVGGVAQGRDGGIEWTVFSRGPDDGVLLLLEREGRRALLGFEASEALAAAAAPRLPPTVDILGWRPRPGAPAALDRLTRTEVRTAVFQGRTASASLRRTGAALCFSARGALAWTGGADGGRWSELAEAPPPVRRPAVW
ncbi:MAG: ComEC/Rec2 family competence protein [Elusimicrobia bacterium]|nr:ComEC/Rec2 family competence protein [Elusimicrobiota bacterium]